MGVPQAGGWVRVFDFGSRWAGPYLYMDRTRILTLGKKLGLLEIILHILGILTCKSNFKKLFLYENL